MDEYNRKVLADTMTLEPVFWINTKKEKFGDVSDKLELKFEDIRDASDRLIRFAPLIKKLFPETVDGIIESELVEIPSMKNEIEQLYKNKINGRLFMKCDSHLEIAGSVKARGGIYEVLKHAEDLAVSSGLLSYEDDYSKLGNEEFKKFFSRYRIAVGSTGNLGLSIGIMASALGFRVTVHMSKDAKQWKKELLRSKGVQIVEHEDDYSKAVEAGRKQCKEDTNTYFVDDENSKDLFLGYSVAALRLKDQLIQKGISINDENELYVYIPCGVGGAPGGISFGLKHVFGDNVHCYLAEPTHSPCMLLGLITGKFGNMHVREYGIDNITEADGLAVGSPSKLSSKIVDRIVDGIYTIPDCDLFKLLSLIKDTEDIKVEPSAASSLKGPSLINTPDTAIHISWATGGLFLPDDIYSGMYLKGKNI